MLPEHGIVSFIRMKLSGGISPHEIKGMLLRAGFHSDNIDHAFRFIKERYPESHQDFVASNDFLPEISKEGVQHQTEISNTKVTNSSRDKHIVQNKNSVNSGSSPYPRQPNNKSIVGNFGNTVKAKIDNNFVTHKGLFQGRLRRKDFTLGFIFFFAVGYVVLTMTAVTISILSPELWSTLLRVIEHDTNGVLLVTIPVVLAPITIMMLSLITRRLHNLGLPGSLSWIFLSLFVPLDISLFPGMWFLYSALGILFVVLLAKKGVPEENEYGNFPQSKGSFFKRIFNV